MKRKAEQSAARNYEFGLSATCVLLGTSVLGGLFALAALTAALSAAPVVFLVSAAAAYVAYCKSAAAGSVSRSASEAAAQAAAAEHEAAATEAASVFWTMITRFLGCATIAFGGIYGLRIGLAVVADLLYCWLRQMAAA